MNVLRLNFQRLFGIASLLLLLLLSACGASEEEVAPTATLSRSEEVASGAVASETVTGELITIVAMGDSLTEGLGVDLENAYPAQLERKLLSDGYNVRVINAGISGETSSGALSRVDWVMTLEPAIIILETGPNDGLRGIDPAVTEQNIDALVGTFQAHRIQVVLAGMQIVQNMGAEYVAEFRTIYPRVAQKHDAILIPFFLEDVGGIKELNQADAVHPTAEGYAIVVETIYPYLLQAVEEIEPLE